jgi:hypothetical protein
MMTPEEIDQEIERVILVIRQAPDKRSILLWLSGWALAFAQHISPDETLPEICTVRSHQQ